MKRIISLLLAVSMMVLCLTGCSNTEKAEKAVSDMMEALKSADYEAMSQHFNIADVALGDSFDAESEVYMGIVTQMFSGLEYTIISSEEKDDGSVVVKTSITNVDMKTVLADYVKNALSYAFTYAFSKDKPSDEEMAQKQFELLSESLTLHAEEKVTNEVDIKVINVDGAWKIDSDEALLDAITGGLKTAAAELGSAFGSIE